MPRRRVSGFPADTDWSRWEMLHDGSAYRIYAFRDGATDQLEQGSWNPAEQRDEYAYTSIPRLDLVGLPATSDVGRSAMLHDGSAYRCYFQTL